MERIDDAVRRILTAKFEMGLFEHPFGDDSLLDAVGSAEHRAVAREAVAKSLVLLKNEGDVLPLAKDTPVIFVAGEAANDIGIQSGGWTIQWQGAAGAITRGTTILRAIEAAVSPQTQVYYSWRANFRAANDAAGNPLMADIGIAVVGERPYAEFPGDDDELALPAGDLRVIAALRERCKTLIVILISGRPLIITDQIEDWDAVVAAWLPGTEGQGVADVLFGDLPFTGRLSYTWPRSAAQLPFDFANLGEGEDGPLFPYGYGLEAR
jgi:beta-glucosidase